MTPDPTRAQNDQSIDNTISMPPRPRRAATKAFASGLPNPEDPDADPEFLALSTRQRQRIDRAFERGLRAAGGRTRKGKRTNDENQQSKAQSPAETDQAGGFVDDGGGFMVDDASDAWGFIVDDDDTGGGGFIEDADEDTGGFIPDTGPSTSTSNSATRPASPSPTARIPLNVLPGLLVSLGLPADEDVLQVFKASASGWDEEEGSSRRRKGPEEPSSGGGVGRKDFRAVCAALMGPEEEGKEGEEDEEEDAFELSDGADSESSLSAVSSTSSFDTKGKGKGNTRSTSRKKRNKDLEEAGSIKLSSRQKEMVADIWKMVKPDASDKPGGRVLGRDEVKSLVRALGEMWNEEEITEMVTLFSTQHEGRGLSYEDFGAVMYRAGLV